jgi:cytochrome c peroxidase
MALVLLLLSCSFLGLPGGTALAAVAVPPIGLLPLNQMAVPEPPNLYQFVKNKAAAVRLGKALFWDMQVGSDGIQACATCHFSAGADIRTKNTVHPGADGVFQVRGPNQTVQDADFPFHQRQAPVDFQASPVLRDSDDAVGSQGVRLTQFLDIVLGSRFDSGASIPDPLFQVNGVNTRQVTTRNAPSVINAVFNFSNFWDGRASAFFNGSSPFGPMDSGAGVWYPLNGTLVKQPVIIEFGSLASQATGPPLNEVEMSYRGRTFPKLGRKMLSLTPLAIQAVHPFDSQLGSLSNAVMQADGTLGGGKGLSTSYAQMIRDAFQDNLWNSQLTTGDGYSQIEANFSLFWGLAVQLYEATLVADNTPYDRFLGGDSTALTDQQQEGFNIFFGTGRCNLCHGGSELTNASVTAAAFLNNLTNGLLELMNVASGKQIVYDNGFNNTSVRLTKEDLGRGGDSPFANPLAPGANVPLSFAAQAELQASGQLPFAAPVLPANLPANFPIANDGAFKVPQLRNVELTGPYFHNGSVKTLDDVVDFYVRGGNFPNANKANLDINIAEIGPLQNEPGPQAALVAFLKAMTDPRVKNQSAPFDHPELFIPHGDPESDATMIHLPATGIGGLGGSTPVTLNVAANLPAPQGVGTPVTFSATAQGGTGSYEYRFWLNDGSGAGFQLKRDYAASGSWTWTPAQAGNYDIFVEARNAGSTVSRNAYAAIYSYQVLTAAATAVTVAPSLASPQAPGTAISFTATGQGGTGPYEYRFYLNSGSGYALTRDYNSNPTWTWTPAAAGSYDIFVEVRAAGTQVLRDAYVVINAYQVQSAIPASALLVTPSVAAPQPTGTPIVFSAAGQGGTGPYEYRFWLNSGSGFLLQQAYGAANSWAWTPSAAGNYDIFVEVRTAGSTALREAWAALYSYHIDTPAPASAVTIAPGLASPQPSGTPITFTANGQGGSGPYEYRFYLNSGSGYVLQRDYNPSNSWTWTPSAAGNYDVFVEVRTVGSSLQREAYNAIYFYQVR